MANTVSMTLQQAFAIVENIDPASSPASTEAGNVRRYDAYDAQGVPYDGTTTTPVIVPPVLDLSHTLAGASFDFDLTAAPLAEDVNNNGDATGLRLLGAKFIAAVGNNAAGLTIGPAVADPYDLFGGSGKITLLPGEEIQKVFRGVAATTPLVSGTAKTVNYQGTAGDIVQAILVFST